MKEYIHPWTVDITETVAGSFIRLAVAFNYFNFEIRELFNEKMILIMKEGKKRWRPSLEKYRALEREYGDALEAVYQQKVRCEDLNRKIYHLEVELKYVREKNELLYDQWKRMKHRGFFARLFNRDV